MIASEECGSLLGFVYEHFRGICVNFVFGRFVTEVSFNVEGIMVGVRFLNGGYARCEGEGRFIDFLIC